jgi:hypothetical protein
MNCSNCRGEAWNAEDSAGERELNGRRSPVAISYLITVVCSFTRYRGYFLVACKVLLLIEGGAVSENVMHQPNSRESWNGSGSPKSHIRAEFTRLEYLLALFISEVGCRKTVENMEGFKF